MMPTVIHAFSQEEMMAYLDGELSSQRALAAMQHLEQCSECQQLAAGFRLVSERLADWKTGPVPFAVPPVRPLEERQSPSLSWWRRPWVFISSTAALILAGGLYVQTGNRGQVVKRVDTVSSAEPMAFTRGEEASGWHRTGRVSRTLVTPSVPAAAPTGPQIVRTAQLSLTSKDFDRDQPEVERIARAHQGYIADLQFTSPRGAGRSLTAGVRVPAGQLDETLSELKRLGHVDSEWQRGEDVTQQVVDIGARLANSRMAEARFLAILRDRTGNLNSVLQVEEAVDRTRGEIERTEAEQKMLASQVSYASVQLSVSEEFKEKLERNDTSVVTRLRNAAIDGYRNLEGAVIGVLAWLLSDGPVLLAVLAAGFLPARWLWRHRRIS